MGASVTNPAGAIVPPQAALESDVSLFYTLEEGAAQATSQSLGLVSPSLLGRPNTTESLEMHDRETHTDEAGIGKGMYFFATYGKKSHRLLLSNDTLDDASSDATTVTPCIQLRISSIIPSSEHDEGAILSISEAKLWHSKPINNSEGPSFHSRPSNGNLLPATVSSQPAGGTHPIAVPEFVGSCFSESPETRNLSSSSPPVTPSTVKGKAVYQANYDVVQDMNMGTQRKVRDYTDAVFLGSGILKKEDFDSLMSIVEKVNHPTAGGE
jgi:hypothetical protein